MTFHVSERALNFFAMEYPDARIREAMIRQYVFCCVMRHQIVFGSPVVLGTEIVRIFEDRISTREIRGWDIGVVIVKELGTGVYSIRGWMTIGEFMIEREEGPNDTWFLENNLKLSPITDLMEIRNIGGYAGPKYPPKWDVILPEEEKKNGADGARRVRPYRGRGQGWQERSEDRAAKDS